MFSLARDLGVKGFGESYYPGSNVSIDQAGTGKGSGVGNCSSGRDENAMRS